MPGYSKLDIVNSAFNEIGFADYAYDLDPAQLNRVLLQLDAMMMTWKSQGINVGYYQTYTPGESDINADSGLPSTAIQACYLGLAKVIAPSFGKAISKETNENFNSAWRALLSNVALVVPYARPGTLVAGAGNRGIINRAFLPSTQPEADDGIFQ